MRSPIQNQIRDVLVRDEPTRTCCGLLQSWVPKIKILEKIKNIRLRYYNLYLKNLNLRKYYRKIN